jgi:hypothetical protein
LLGPEVGIKIFWGKKVVPFCGRVCSIPARGRAMLPFRKNTRRRKRKKSLSRILAITEKEMEL